jgi:hypothetical protein
VIRGTKIEYLRRMRISPRIFKKIEITILLLSGASGKMIHEKNLKQKISRDTVPLNCTKCNVAISSYLSGPLKSLPTTERRSTEDLNNKIKLSKNN